MISKLLGITSILEKFIPDISEREKALSEIEKQKLVLLSKIWERAGIPSVFFTYILIIINNYIIIPWVKAFWVLDIEPQQMPEHFTTLVLGLAGIVMGKKTLDKRVKKKGD